MADRTLTVKIIGDESDLLRSFRRSTSATQRFSASFGTFVKGAVIFEGVRRGIDAIGGALRSGIDEFSQMQTVAAQTNAVLKSTGGVANVSAGGVERLAERLSRLSGVDDEAIASAENLILTFKNVRNELGDGNRIFDRTTAAALDLSKAAGGAFGSLDSSAKQLAKALNDPVRGMTALGRAGITFTESQRDTIKALVDSNRLLDAQKLILREVESQVGGSARAFGETLPGQLSKIREAFRNAFGNLVAVVAQPLATALGAFANFVPKIEAGVARISGAVGPALNDLVDSFVRRLPELRRIVGSILDPLRENVLPILTEFAAIAGRVWANVVQVFDQNRESIRGILKNLGETLAAVWTLARPTIVLLFEKVLPAALNVAIPVIEKLTSITRIMAQAFVQSVQIIIRVLDVFLGGLSKLTDAASHLPFIGDKFAGISDHVNAARGELRAFGEGLDLLDGRTVDVRINISVDRTTGRREEGALGRTNTIEDAGDEVEKETKGLERVFRTQETGARRIETAATKATTATKVAITAAERQRRERERLREAAETRREQRRARQFERLGLTATGDDRVPGVTALRSRLGNVREQIRGTVLDTTKTRSQLQRIAKVLSGAFGKVGRDVRQSILQMLNDISSALSGGASGGGGAGGPLTATSGLSTKKILEGLGLSEQQVRELRGRLSSVNTAGRTLSAIQPTTALAGFGGAQGAVFVESHTTINLDGETVAKVVTKQQQKGRRRNPPQKRGPNRNR